MSDDPNRVSRRSLLTAFAALVTGAATAASGADALGFLFDYGQVSKAEHMHMNAGKAGSAKKKANPTHQDFLEYVADMADQLQKMAVEIGEHELARQLQRARDAALMGRT